MFPNAFLKTLWRVELRPQIFVAMSFDPAYEQRYTQVIAPAIQGISVGGQGLQPYRVDLSKSGDSILTEIIDGIAHCQMFLADVSTAGKDSVTGRPYRNGNVMYEVGLALACRQPSEILLIRDDRDKFLFDVSTIPHLHIDFSRVPEARSELQSTLVERMKERAFLNDARVRLAIACLSDDELAVIKSNADNAPPVAWGFPSKGTVNFLSMAAIPRLLDKQLIQLAASWSSGGGAYQWTPLGFQVAQIVKTRLPTVEPAKPPDDTANGPPPAEPPQG